VRPQTVQPSSGADQASGTTGHRPGGPPSAARPVFVDPSGRRQRRVRRLGRLLVIPAAGYVALLLSAAFGGPSVESPYLPLPAAGGHGPGTATTGPAAPGATGRAPTAGHRSGTPATGAPAAHVTTGGTPTTGGSSPSPSAPGATASASPSATAVPTVTHGKSTATHPVPTHTVHGHG
jgi:hypothetical protein